MTDRDLLAVASGAENKNAGSCASEVLVPIAPDERLEVVCELMRAHGVSHVMVVDPEHNQPLGVVSTLDVAGIVAWGRAMTGTALVGYDGSETARAALAYAAQRGRSRRAALSSRTCRRAADELSSTRCLEGVSSRTSGRARRGRSMRDVEDLLGGVTAELAAWRRGHRSRTLVELAREAGADEIVVGSRGFGWQDARCWAA